MKRLSRLLELGLLQVLLLPVRLYRKILSPVMPPACRSFVAWGSQTSLE